MHYELLRAFTPDEVLRRASVEPERGGYLTHEFGDSAWIEKVTSLAAAQPAQDLPVRV